jgi:UDP-3-O-[3-hydroxymyristoyl] glucosamine N-acyltransferase LpxD
VLVHRYPAECKAFYMKRDPERPRGALCVDMLAPEGYGEIIGGGQREDDLATARGSDRRAQACRARPSSGTSTCAATARAARGFGMGIERTVAWICGLTTCARRSPSRAVDIDQPAPSTWVETFVHPTATVHPSAILGVASAVHAGAFVGAWCQVGAGTVLYPNVVLYPGTVVGDRCRIHAGAVLGADGFRYQSDPKGPQKVPQVGRVIVGDDVEIGPNCVIDRAFLEATRIGDGSKLDGLVMVGHNVQIGRGAVLAAQVGLAGGVKVGDGAMLGGQAGVAEHREIGAGAMVAGQSGVGRDVPPGEAVLGSPAMPLRVARRVYAVLPRLPELVRALTREKG